MPAATASPLEFVLGIVLFRLATGFAGPTWLPGLLNPQ
jgi:hypothetical protein